MLDFAQTALDNRKTTERTALQARGAPGAAGGGRVPTATGTAGGAAVGGGGGAPGVTMLVPRSQAHDGTNCCGRTAPPRAACAWNGVIFP